MVNPVASLRFRFIVKTPVNVLFRRLRFSNFVILNLMEDKLAEYRARKRKDEMIPTLIKKIKKVSFAGIGSQEDDLASSRPLMDDSLDDDSPNPRINRSRSPNSDLEMLESDTSELDISCPKVTWLTKASYALGFLLWATLFAIAINLEFGAVYFIISSLYLLWKNTRTGPKKEGEISAYSVFNPNCEAIEGTLKAEQFEQEIRFGAASVH